ncbi:MAG: lipopolysaccharide biosynthesis protein RfbH [Firmicutes bacterium]|nr:lipopolysaccharide biosynthesis protein RfbH [Bacillota bacterium]
MSRWTDEKSAREEIRGLVSEYYESFLKKKPEEFRPGDRIPYASRVFDEKEVCSLVDSALDFWLTTGRFSRMFEESFAEYLGAGHAALVNSGSSANLLAFAALTAPELGERRIRPGDEVITAACGFPTTVAPILQYGAVPVFADITIPQYNIDVSQLESLVSPRTRAVMIAHTLGNPFDLRGVREFCSRHGLWLIEDNCDALGSLYTIDDETKYTGTWGDIGTSSFYPPHHMTMGEGGCVYTDDALLHRMVLSYRDWGRNCVCPSGMDNVCGHRFDGSYGELPYGYDHKYVYSHLGYNLKVTDMQAAAGVEQLKKLPGFISARRRNWEYLYKRLQELEETVILPEAAANSEPSWFGFMITLREDSRVSRDELTRALEASNIQTRLLFAGNLIRQPCFDEYRGTDVYRTADSLDNTDYVMRNSFWIGVYPGMTEAMLDYMADQIIEKIRASQ